MEAISTRAFAQKDTKTWKYQKTWSQITTGMGEPAQSIVILAD